MMESETDCEEEEELLFLAGQTGEICNMEKPQTAGISYIPIIVFEGWTGWPKKLNLEVTMWQVETAQWIHL